MDGSYILCFVRSDVDGGVKGFSEKLKKKKYLKVI